MDKESIVRFYDNMWSDESSARGVSATLRRRQVIRFVRAYASGEELDILDLGCGKGYLSAALSRFGSVTGVDLASETIEKNKQRFAELRFVRGDVTDPQLPCSLSRYDLVVSSEVIEHLRVRDREQFLSNVYAILRSRGLFIVTTPDREVFLQQKRPSQDEPAFLDSLDEQPINNLMTKNELIGIVSERFDILDFASVQPLVKTRLIDLLWKGLFWPFDYLAVNVLTSSLGISGKYMVLATRKKEGSKSFGVA